MEDHVVVSREEWLLAREKLLSGEKEFTRLRDQLSKQRRALPWVRIEKAYSFDGPQGEETLSDLFEGNSQLIVYHFMYGPEWSEGCPSCSFWADNYNGVSVHLRHRDISFVVISRAPWEVLENYRKRMGWSFKWISSGGSDFNYDFHVSFSNDEMQQDAVYYNYAMRSFPSEEAPGVSVFFRNKQGEVFHTYSCYSRGLDNLNGAYHHMDLVPKGRDEAGLPYSMAWLERHDQYDN